MSNQYRCSSLIFTLVRCLLSDRFRSEAMTIPAVPIDPPLTGDGAWPSKRAPSAIRNMVVSLLGDVGLPVAAYLMAELLGATTYGSPSVSGASTFSQRFCSCCSAPGLF